MHCHKHPCFFLFFLRIHNTSAMNRVHCETLFQTVACFTEGRKKNSPKPGLVALCEETIALTPDASFLYFRHPHRPAAPQGCQSSFTLTFLYIQCFLSLVFHLSLPHPPLTPSMSQSFGLLCLPLLLSWTHVGLIELEDPALIKGRVWLNTSKPPRLQSRTG